MVDGVYINPKTAVGYTHRSEVQQETVRMKVATFVLAAVAAVTVAQKTRGGFGGGFISAGIGSGGGGGCNGGYGCGGGGGGGGGGGCRYWCRTPNNQYYCCENGGSHPGNRPIVKPGRCPPVRPRCPPTRFAGRPNQCSSDSSCPGAEKCCYDTCLNHHTCKSPGYH